MRPRDVYIVWLLAGIAIGAVIAPSVIMLADYAATTSCAH
jgi:hypothetical protein